MKRVSSALALAAAGLIAACAADAPTDEATGGVVGSGGSGPAAGGSSGGTAPTGGVAPATGGTVATMTGGSSGTTATGGMAPSTGGTVSTMTGGAAGTGGVVAASGGMTQAGAGGAPNGGAGASGEGGSTGGAIAGGTGGAGGTGDAGGGSGGTSAHVGAWHIMPLGDSITGTTCYPQLLSQKLKDGGHDSFDFLGSITNNQSCNGAPNVVTEGHGGYILGCLTGDYTANCASKGSPSELSTWLSAMPAPEVALVHFGTNDVWNSISTETVTASYTHLLTSLRGANPNVIVFIAQILPMHPDNCMDGDASCPNARVQALNAAIPDWASGATTAASPVHVVDIYHSVDAATFVPNSANTSDGVHPNATGSGPIADTWMAALLAHGIAD